jgi:hypothetical protein
VLAIGSVLALAFAAVEAWGEVAATDALGDAELPAAVELAGVSADAEGAELAGGVAELPSAELEARLLWAALAEAEFNG